MRVFPPQVRGLPWSRLFDLVTPPRCVECDQSPVLVGRDGPSPFCSPCHRDLPWWRRIDGCPRCGTRIWPSGEEPKIEGRRGRALERDSGGEGITEWEPLSGSCNGCAGCLSGGSPLHACHTLLRYEGAVRRWIPALKRPIGFLRPFGPSPPILRAIETLAECLAESLREELAGELDLVVSVPLHPRRLRERGFNHVDPIARRIARNLGLDWRGDALERTRRTSPQASLSGSARKKNVRGAFACRRRFDRELRIGLVDDVLTTGSTLEAAAEALLEAGAFEVRSLTLAATLPRLPDDLRGRRWVGRTWTKPGD